MPVNRIRVAVVALSVAAAGLLVTPVVSADEIWYQSVGRASATATCQDSSATELAAGWTVWRPIWEQWMNRGTGGFTCSRALTWAKSSPASGGGGGGAAGCQQITLGPIKYASFGANNFIAANSPTYTSASCTGSSTADSDNLAYASSQANADAICVAQKGAGWSADAIDHASRPTNIWKCST